MAEQTAAQRKVHAEYMKRYQKRPEVAAKKRNRNNARYLMIKKGKASRNDGKDIDHKNGNARDNRLSNLRVMSARKNRSRNNNK